MKLTSALTRGGLTTQAAIWLLRRARAGYRTLVTDERRDARTLLGKSRGRPANLTKAERRRLRGLARRVVVARPGRITTNVLSRYQRIRV